jgi:IS30 family transposase
MRSYSHLSDDERDQIGVLRGAGQSIGAIAKALGRAKTTISRELRRNALPSGRYSPLHAAGAYQLLRQREVVLGFCDAYASWQKGGVENANGRLGRWLHRPLDIDQLSDAEIQDIVITANRTPRKCLGFKTPFQAILADLGKDVQIRFS